jgi:hypothetical protein
MLCSSLCVDCTFKSTKNKNPYILDSLNKSEISGNCGFPLANPHKGSSIDCVPYGASRSILLKILDFWGRMWEIWIFINFNVLEDKLHYCKKSCAIFMIVCFHLLCLAPGLLLAGDAKFRSVFLSPEYRFLFESLGACISPLHLSYNALYTAFWEKNNVDYFFLSLDLI